MIQYNNCVEHFKNVILDKLPEGCWLAGGCVRDYMAGQYTRYSTDHDVFTPNDDIMNLIKKFIDGDNGTMLFESESSIKFSYLGLTVDVIKHHFPTMEDTIDNFDFTVCMFAVDKNRFVASETSFIDLAKKQLMIHKLPYPESSMWRMTKYIGKGYGICKGELSKLIDACKNVKPIMVQDKPDQQPDAPMELSFGSSDSRNRFRGID